MKNLKLLITIGGLLTGLFLLTGCTGQEATETNSNLAVNDSGAEETITKSNCVADDCLLVAGLEYPAGDLTEDIITALDKAIDDEYKARATYEAVMNEIGSVRPFSMIIRAEEQHISSLKAIYDKYGAPIPEDSYDVSTLTVPDNRQESCQVGVEAEIANAALYEDELLPAVTSYEDITTVFTELMNASKLKHLPSFENCS